LDWHGFRIGEHSSEQKVDTSLIQVLYFIL
jgi:hypothetical protein